MLKRTIGYLALGATGLTGTLIACGSPPAANPATTTSATVSVDVYDATSTKVDTCMGTLISADAVLIAGHCAAGFSSWQVTSATGTVVHSSVAYTYDWQNFKSDMSHPDHDDVAVIKLAGQIALPSYPTLAASALPSGTGAMRVRPASGGGFEAIGVMANDGAAVGFPHYYFTSIDPSEALVPGGALIDPNTNIIYGVSSGVGSTTKNLYLSRVEMVTSWLQTMASCSTGSSADIVVECHTGSGSGSSSGGGSNSSSTGSSSSGSSSSGSSSGSSGSGSNSGSTSSGSSSGSTGSSGGLTGEGVPPPSCGNGGGSCQGSGCSPSGGGNGANSGSGGGSGGGDTPGTSSGSNGTNPGTSSGGTGTGTGSGGTGTGSGGTGTSSGSNGTNTGTSSGGTGTGSGGTGTSSGASGTSSGANGTSGGTSSGANGTSSGTSSGGNGDTGNNGGDGPGCTDSTCGGCGDDPTCSDNTEDFGGVPGTSQGSASANPH